MKRKKPSLIFFRLLSFKAVWRVVDVCWISGDPGERCDHKARRSQHAAAGETRRLHRCLRLQKGRLCEYRPHQSLDICVSILGLATCKKRVVVVIPPTMILPKEDEELLNGMRKCGTQILRGRWMGGLQNLQITIQLSFCGRLWSSKGQSLKSSQCFWTNAADLWCFVRSTRCLSTWGWAASIGGWLWWTWWGSYPEWTSRRS